MGHIFPSTTTQLTHIARPRVEVDGAPRRDQLALVDDILDRRTRQRKTQHRVEAQTLPDQRDNVCALLVIVRIGQRLVLGVNLADLVHGLVLDIRPLCQQRNAPLHKRRDGVEAARQHRQTDRSEFLFVERRLLVLDDIGLDARLVCALLHAVVEVLVQAVQIRVASEAVLLGHLGAAAEGVQPEDRDVVLQIASRGSELADGGLDFGDLVEHGVVAAAHARPPVQRQTERQRQPLNHRHGIHTHGPRAASLKPVLDKVLGLQIQVVDIRSDARLVQRRCSALPPPLQAVIKRTGANCRPRRVRQHLVERPEHRPRAQRLAVAAEDLPRGLGAVHHHHGLVAKLDLVHCAVLLGPLAVLVGGIVLDVWDVTHERPVPRPREALQASGVADIFIRNEIGDGREEDEDQNRAKRVVDKLLRDKGSNGGDHLGMLALIDLVQLLWDVAELRANAARRQFLIAQRPSERRPMTTALVWNCAARNRQPAVLLRTQGSSRQHRGHCGEESGAELRTRRGTHVLLALVLVFGEL